MEQVNELRRIKTEARRIDAEPYNLLDVLLCVFAP